MKVESFISNVISVNVYVCYDEDSKDCVVFDPSGTLRKVFEFIETNELKPLGIILTHGHFDHIYSVEKFKNKYDVPVLACKKEIPLLLDGEKNFSIQYCKNPIEISPDIAFEDGETITFGKINFKVLETPGHSLGSCCFYSEEDGILISGDTLFKGSIGRTDLEFSAPDKIIPSIKEKLLCLPDETVVYPGHNDTTTIAFEKQYNQFIK